MPARRIHPALLTMTASGLAVLLFAASAPAGCAGEAPDAVLKCYSEAHELRDASVLESLLASDYIWITVAPPQAQVFDREFALEASGNMFASEHLEHVSYTFHDGYKVVNGVEEGTWRIENVRAELSAKTDSAEEPYVTTACVTLYVRETSVNEPGYEIYREVTFEGIGCGDE